MVRQVAVYFTNKLSFERKGGEMRFGKIQELQHLSLATTLRG